MGWGGALKSPPDWGAGPQEQPDWLGQKGTSPESVQEADGVGTQLLVQAPMLRVQRRSPAVGRAPCQKPQHGMLSMDGSQVSTPIPQTDPERDILEPWGVTLETGQKGDTSLPPPHAITAHRPPPCSPLLRPGAGACSAQTRCLQCTTTLISEMGSAGKRLPPPPPGHPQTGAFPGFTGKAGAVHHHQCHFGAFPLPSGPPPPCWRCSGGSRFGPFLSLWCGDSPVTAGIRGSWLHPEAPGTTQDGSWVPASASVPITSSQVPILGSNLGTPLPHIPVPVVWGCS